MIVVSSVFVLIRANDRPERVAHPQHVGVLVRAHAPRALRPRQRRVESEVAHRLVEGAVLAEHAVDRLDVGQLDLDRLAAGEVGLVRPCPSPSATTSRCRRGRRRRRRSHPSRAVLLGRRERNSVNFSVAGSKRTAPLGVDAHTMPLPSMSMVTAPPSGAISAASGRSRFSRLPCRACRARGARIHVEPEVAGAVAREPVSRRRKPVGRLGLEVLHRAGRRDRPCRSSRRGSGCCW